MLQLKKLVDLYRLLSSPSWPQSLSHVPMHVGHHLVSSPPSEEGKAEQRVHLSSPGNLPLCCSIRELSPWGRSCVICSSEHLKLSTQHRMMKKEKKREQRGREGGRQAELACRATLSFSTWHKLVEDKAMAEPRRNSQQCFLADIC